MVAEKLCFVARRASHKTLCFLSCIVIFFAQTSPEARASQSPLRMPQEVNHRSAPKRAPNPRQPLKLHFAQTSFDSAHSFETPGKSPSLDGLEQFSDSFNLNAQPLGRGAAKSLFSGKDDAGNHYAFYSFDQNHSESSQLIQEIRVIQRLSNVREVIHSFGIQRKESSIFHVTELAPKEP